MQAVSPVIAVTIVIDHYMKLVENVIKNAKRFAENKEKLLQDVVVSMAATAHVSL